MKEKSLQIYSMNSTEPFLEMTLAEKVLHGKEDLQGYEKRTREERNKNSKKKGTTVHGEFIKQTDEVMNENS